MELLETLLDASTHRSMACPCGWYGKHCIAFIESLRQRYLWPKDIPRRTIWQAIEAVETMRDPNPERKDVFCPTPGRHSDGDFRTQLGWRMVKLKKQDGLCLLCIRSGEEHRTHGKTMESVSLT